MSDTMNIPKLHGRKLRRWAIRHRVPVRVVMSEYWPFVVPLHENLLGSVLIPKDAYIFSVDAEMVKPHVPLTRGCLMPDLPDEFVGCEIRA